MMFLTRLGEESRMVVTGDVTQIDLPEDQRSGLIAVRDILNEVQDISFVNFGGEDVARLTEKGVIEIAPLAYMRGRTLSHAFIVLDEAQNTTPEQMKMFLTRIGFGSKAVVTGDVTQIDLDGGKSGLINLEQVLSGIDGLAFIRLDARDVVRHKIVQDIVNAYDQARSMGVKP